MTPSGHVIPGEWGDCLPEECPDATDVKGQRIIHCRDLESAFWKTGVCVDEQTKWRMQNSYFASGKSRLRNFMA